MGRRKGSVNKEVLKPVESGLDTEARIRLLADLLVEVAFMEKTDAT